MNGPLRWFGRYGFDECEAWPPNAYYWVGLLYGDGFKLTTKVTGEACRRRPGHVGPHRNMVREWVDPGPPARYTFAVPDQVE